MRTHQTGRRDTWIHLVSRLSATDLPIALYDGANRVMLLQEVL